FTRRELREALKAGDTQLKVHLNRLLELELLALHRGRHGAFEYELLHDGKGDAGAPVLSGLTDVQALGHGYDAKRSALESERSGPGRPRVGGQSGGGRPGAPAEFASGFLPLAASGTSGPENSRQSLARNGASYSHVVDVASLSGGGP